MSTGLAFPASCVCLVGLLTGHRDAEIRASLQDMRPCIDEMTPETREAFFKALLGERFCIMDLVWVLSACEAPPQRSLVKKFRGWADPKLIDVALDASMFQREERLVDFEHE